MSGSGKPGPSGTGNAASPTEYICFDLDGTLLDVDLRAFMQAYIGRASRAFARWVPPERFAQQLLASTNVMVAATDASRTLLETFAEDFFPKLGLSPEHMAVFDRFYTEEFPALRELGRPIAGVQRLLDAAVARGYRLVLATNPVFPKKAIRERMRWAGVEGYPWRLITSCENMHAAKPHIAYYEEILHHLGARGAQCLMVGNDPERDLPAGHVGMRTFLVRPSEGEAPDDPLAYWPIPGDGKHGKETFVRVRPDYTGTLDDLRQLIESGALD